MKPLFSQTTLLRLAAFVTDALSASLLLVFFGSIFSYGLAWSGGSGKAITMVWFVSGALLIAYVLLRDGRGRSPGKRLLGLRLQTRSGRPCGLIRSFVRNLPLMAPGWNLLEGLLVISGRQRTGDRLAGTSVEEE